MKKFKGMLLACDMDGTLLDSMPIWDRVGIDYLAGLGIQARPDLPERLLTMSMRQAAAYFRSGYGDRPPFGRSRIAAHRAAQLFFLPSHLHRGGLRQGQSGYFCIGTEKTGHTAGTDGGL